MEEAHIFSTEADSGEKADAGQARQNPPSLGRRVAYKILRSFRERPLAFQLTAGTGWIITGYALVLGLLGGLYSRKIGRGLEDFVLLVSSPLNAYLDLPGWIGVPAGAVMIGACLTGGWAVVAPLIPPRKRSAASQPQSRPVEEFAANLIPDLAEIDEKEQIPEHIQKMITRFVDLQTLQPVGVLRSVLILLDSDIEAYRHLLTTPLCIRSMEHLRQLPPDVFNDEHCHHVLSGEEFRPIFLRLGLEKKALVPTLVSRIEGERTKTPPPGV